MASVTINTTPTVKWSIAPERGGSWVAKVTLNANDVSDLLNAPDYGLVSVQMTATTFGGAGAGLFGANNPTGLAYSLHPRDNSVAGTFDTGSADIFAQVIESPRFFYAQGSATTSALAITIMLTDKKKI